MSARLFEEHSDYWPWPSPVFGAPHDALCSLFYGASGAAIVEADLFIALHKGVHLERACVYCDLALHYFRHIRPRVNAGLVFGFGGLAWALARVYEVSGRDLGLQSVVAAVLEAPPSGTDLSHGAAGRGLVLLRAYKLTSDPMLLVLAHDLAAQVLDAHLTDGLLDKGKVSGFGFAHGLAGEAYFLYELSRLCDRDDYRAFVGQAVDVLLSVAVQEGGRLSWGTNWQDLRPRPYWCHGTSGVGLLLLRTGNLVEVAASLSALLLAAPAVPDYGLCHGFASIAEYTLEARGSGVGVGELPQSLLTILEARLSNPVAPTWRAPTGEPLAPNVGYGMYGLLHALARWVDHTVPHPTLLP